MKKFDKRDYLNILILIIILLAVILFVVSDKYIYGSMTDWCYQHFTIPEYFRTLFYKTNDLFPDFAFNIGAGQNIYNFSYYGLLSPIILISYLFPFISMMDYIIISSILIIIISFILLYKWLKNNNYSSTICFIASLIFLCSAPLIFHSHRHIMFMNYFAFLILGLIGIDKYFLNGKRYLILISTVLMIFTSYYFSVGGIVVYGIYGIYKYLNKTDKYSFKGLVTKLFKLVYPIVIAITISAVLLLPTIYVLLSGERGSNNISILELILPSFKLDSLLYSSYSIGLTAISVIAIIYSIIKKEKRFLGIVVTLIVLFPIFNYILNGTLYMNAKSLIPFIPLVILLIADFLKDFRNIKNYKLLIFILGIISILLFINNPAYKWVFVVDLVLSLFGIFLSIKYNKNIFLWIIIIITSISITLVTNLRDKLVLKDSIISSDDLVESITSTDSSVYRMEDLTSELFSVNRVYNTNYYQATEYTSTYNSSYHNYFYNIFNNPITYRNKFIIYSNNNVLFENYMGIKYIVSNNSELLGYKLLGREGNSYLYENLNAYPIGYVNSNTISTNYFNKLKYPYNVEALINNTVTSDSSNDNFNSNIEKIDLDYTVTKLSGIKILNNKYKVANTGNMTLGLKNSLKNQIVFIRFKMKLDQSCSKGDTSITINNITNTLTCKSWKYHNNNYTFDYVLAENNLSELNITLSKGEYIIDDIETYILDYGYVDDINNSLQEFVIDKVDRDTITGSIDVIKDGYFNLSIPYDKGFKIYVNGKEISYSKINNTFIGFKLKKGTYDIKIVYEAPYKNIGLIISVIGIVLMIHLLYKEKR